MKSAEKEAEMEQFVKGETQILVATTVIEVGVNVPNASVMVILDAQRFGLSQLHQLRGRVGRGCDQSYCILVTGYKLSEETRKRINIMCDTNDGFRIAEADLKLRGPGDLEGTQQSGMAFDLKIANIARDGQLVQLARTEPRPSSMPIRNASILRTLSSGTASGSSRKPISIGLPSARAKSNHKVQSSNIKVQSQSKWIKDANQPSGSLVPTSPWRR